MGSPMPMDRTAATTAFTLTAALCSFALTGCGTTSKPVRLIVAVTSAPTASLARLKCLRESSRETKTPAAFEVFTNHTPCVLSLIRKGYDQMDVEMTEEMLVARIIPPQPETPPEPAQATGEGALSALLSVLQHSVELLCSAGHQTSVAGLRPDVRLHYALVRTTPAGAIGEEDSRSNRMKSSPATTLRPATNPHHSPTIPIFNPNPSSSATGNPTSQ